MRIYIAIALIAVAKAQIGDALVMPTSLNKEFGDANSENNVAKDIEDFQDKINGEISAEHNRQKTEMINKFLADAEKELNDFKADSNKTEKNVGHFKVHFQKKCEIDMPTPVVIPEDPTELDCIKGAFDGKYLAESITKITKDNLKSPDAALGVFYECELVMQQKLSFNLNLYDSCLEGDFKEYYDQFFHEFVQKMDEKGFKYDQATEKFVYDSGKISVDSIDGFSNEKKD